MRTHYRNGDEIGLSCGCDGCSPSMINGVLCHETGCTYAWRDHQIECSECGIVFYPEDRWQKTCDDCVRSNEDYMVDDDEEDESCPE